MEFLIEVIKKIGSILEPALRWLFFLIGQFLYKLVIDLYATFQLLCNARIIDSEVMESIATRIGFLLGTVMLFIVIFSFIKMLIDPETINDKKNGAVNIIKKCIIVIVLLGSSQFIFDGLFRIQRIIISENIISKIILPNELDTENFGPQLAAEVFTAFYRIDSRLIDDETGEPINGDVSGCASSVNRLKHGIYTYSNFDAGRVCLTETIELSPDGEDEGVVEAEIPIVDYNFLLSTGAAIGLIWFLFSYCVSVGMRVIQLLLLEIIAPMAIISHLSPKDDNMLKKWTSIYISTYIDVFLRVAIINFAAFLIAAIFDNWNDGLFIKTIGNPTGYTYAFIMVIMIIAILSFAKKAPELLKNLIPSAAGSGLGFGASFKNMLGLGGILAGGLGLGVGIAGRLPGAIGKTGKAVGLMKKDFTAATNSREKLKALGKGALGTGGAFLSGAGAVLVTGGLGGAIRGAHAGWSKGGVFSSLQAGQQASAKANLARAQRLASGKGVKESASDAIKGFFGAQGGYAGVDQSLQAYNNLNSLINDEDIVKNYQTMYEKAIENISLIKSNGGSDDQIRDAENYARQAEAQLKAVKASLFDSIANGSSFGDGTIITDANGNDFALIGKIEANDGMKHALENVTKVSGKSYENFESFKTDRRELQAESQRLHKSS